MEEEDGDEVSPPLRTDKEVISLAEYIEDMAGYYMSIGVPYDLYWWGDYTMLRYFHEANRQRIENQNHMMWMQGMYFSSAINAALSNFAKGLSGKRGTEKYVQKPVRLTRMSEKEILAEQEAAQQKLIAQLDGMAKSKGKLTLSEQQSLNIMDGE